jgi:hypothetical protein
MIFYHRTTAANAMSILSDGFRDATGNYLTDRESSGVWLSDVPLGVNEGCTGDTLLRVTLNLSESKAADWEWVEEGKPYREWQIPADIINRCGVVALVEDDDPS